MTTLYLLRHAKSDWAAEYGADHDRPLNDRGRAAAAKVGRFLAAIEQVPERVVSSSALRARTTAELAAAAGGWSVDVALARELYGATPRMVLDRVRGESNEHASLLLVGHEPTWSAVAGRLIGGAALRMPTAGLVRIDFSCSWRRAEFGGGELAWHVRPKILGRLEPEVDG